MKTVKYIFLAIFLSVAALSLQAQFTINQMPVVLNAQTNTFLCTIPETLFGHDFTATIMVDDDNVEQLTVNGEPIDFVGACTFKQVEGGKNYAVSIVKDGQTTQYGITFTFLPLVLMDGDFGYDYAEGTVSVIMPGDSKITPMRAQVKWRGGSTNYAQKHKRNYHIKFIDENGEKMDRKFFGLRNDNSWLLDAGQIDLARIRNHVGTALWNDYAAKPYYANVEPKALNGARSEMVEVVLNGNWRGIYSMGEALDRKQMKLMKYDEDTKEIHGLLWKSVSWSETVLMEKTTHGYKNTASNWRGFEVKYPDIEDVSPTNWKTLFNAIYPVANGSDEDFAAKVGIYFDIPVLIDYRILVQVLNAPDNLGKNMYWGIYDRSQYKMLTIAPWDLDATVGQYWNNLPDDGQIQAALNPEYVLSDKQKLFKRLISLNPDNFNERVQKRYAELRKGVLDEDNLVHRYVSEIERLQRAGAASREEVKWSGDSDIQGLTLNFEYQKGYIADWLRKRLHYLDLNVFYYAPTMADLDDSGAVDVTDVNRMIDMVLGKENTTRRADLNSDGTVDVQDVNMLIDIVLGKY